MIISVLYGGWKLVSTETSILETLVVVVVVVVLVGELTIDECMAYGKGNSYGMGIST